MELAASAPRTTSSVSDAGGLVTELRSSVEAEMIAAVPSSPATVP
jgi:hypothetical protein